MLEEKAALRPGSAGSGPTCPALLTQRCWLACASTVEMVGSNVFSSCSHAPMSSSGSKDAAMVRGLCRYLGVRCDKRCTQRKECAAAAGFRPPGVNKWA